MSYKPDKMLEEALKHSATAIAKARIERADYRGEWTMGKETTVKEKKKWIASAYFPRLRDKLIELAEEISEYIKEVR